MPAMPHQSRRDDENIGILFYVESLLAEKDKRDQQRFDAQSSAINAALQAAKEAVTKAETATEKRFDGVNEFRGALQDSAKNLITRVEVEAWREQARDTVAALASRLQLIEGRSLGLNAGWGYLAAFIGLAVGIGAIVLAFLHNGGVGQ